MNLRNVVEISINETKEFSKVYDLYFMFNNLKVNNLEDAINKCVEKFSNFNYVMPLNWQGTFKMYYHFKKNKLFLTTSKSKFSFYSKDVYEVKFTSDYQKLRYMFNVVANLSCEEKLKLSLNQKDWVKEILNSSRDVLDDLVEDD